MATTFLSLGARGLSGWWLPSDGDGSGFRAWANRMVSGLQFYICNPGHKRKEGAWCSKPRRRFRAAVASVRKEPTQGPHPPVTISQRGAWDPSHPRPTRQRVREEKGLTVRTQDIGAIERERKLGHAHMSGSSSPKSLPEFGSLPSVIFFAECFISDTRQRALCRVPRKKPSVKENTRRRSSLPSVFAECHKYNTQQRALCRVFFLQH
jgi:hypothetical protein